ncbi:MAG: hypothetical protein HY228_01655 [Candidatus Yonathbacteria bacterium]|nr:hypothetical protein [Candidatus Yonathbacteria bacterium]
MYNQLIKWEAPESEHREHTADWYWAVSIVTVSLAIAFFIAGNILLSLILIIGIGTLLVHSKHPPKMVSYEISRKGIRAGKTIYLWDSLDSFWLQEEDTPREDFIEAKLLLTSKKHFMPHIIIHLDNAPLEEIHTYLSKMLNEKYQVEPFPHRIMHRLGF